MPKRHKRLEWMSEAELIEQLAILPMDSELRKLKIEPTDDDCKNARPGRPTMCAISMAVRRMLPKASFVCTKHNGITVTIGGHYLHFMVPAKASQAIWQFDARGTKPPPVTVHLATVAKVAELTDARKAQVNLARNKRRAEGRPDKTYDIGPLRLRTTKLAKAAAKEAEQAA